MNVYILFCVAHFPSQLYRMLRESNPPAVCRAGHFNCTVCVTHSGLLYAARPWSCFRIWKWGVDLFVVQYISTTNVNLF